MGCERLILTSGSRCIIECVQIGWAIMYTFRDKPHLYILLICLHDGGFL